MKSFSIFLLLIPSCAGITFGGSGMNLLCVNDNSFNWIHEGEVKGCRWLKEQSNKFRYDICADEIIQKACPTSCGLCCENDFFFRISIDGEDRDCSWISKSSSNKSEYCGREDVKNACPQVCDSCPSKVTIEMLQSDKETEEEHEVVTLAPVSKSSSTPSKQSPISTKSKDEFSSFPTNAPIEIDTTETKKGVTTSHVLAPSPVAFPSISTNEVKLLLPTNAPIEIKNKENDTNSNIEESDKSTYIHMHDADDSMIDDNKQASQIEENHETITDGVKSGASHAVMPVVVGVALATVGVGTGIFVKRHLQRRG